MDRTHLSNVKSVCDIVYFILGYVAVRAFLNGTNIRTVALLVLPLVCTMLIPLFMIHEPSTLDGKMDGASEAVGLIASLRYTLKNRTFLIWMGVYCLMTFGVQLFLGGINEYFSFVGMNMIFVMVAAFLPVPLTLMLYNHVIRRHGFVAAFRYVLLVYSVGMIVMCGAGFMAAGILKTVLSVLLGVVCSFAIGALFSVAYSVPAQLAADEEKETGISNSAMYFAVQGLFSGVATGIATGVVLTALKGREEAASGAIIYMTLIAGLGTLAAFAFTFCLPQSLKELGREKK